MTEPKLPKLKHGLSRLCNVLGLFGFVFVFFIAFTSDDPVDAIIDPEKVATSMDDFLQPVMLFAVINSKLEPAEFRLVTTSTKQELCSNMNVTKMINVPETIVAGGIVHLCTPKNITVPKDVISRQQLERLAGEFYSVRAAKVQSEAINTLALYILFSILVFVSIKLIGWIIWYVISGFS